MQPRIFAGVDIFERIKAHYNKPGAVNRTVVNGIEIIRHELIGPDDVVTQWEAAAGLVEELKKL